MNPSFDAGDLLSPETYARESKGQHAEIQAHRTRRTVHIGPYAALMFEDAATVRFQLQEALRIEGIAEDTAVRAEMDAYAVLLPDGSSFEATFELVFADASEQRARSAQLAGVETAVWMQVEGQARFFAVAGASRARAAVGRLPAARYLRFDPDKTSVRQLRKGSRLLVGIDHPACRASLVLAEDVRQLLLRDLR